MTTKELANDLGDVALSIADKATICSPEILISIVNRALTVMGNRTEIVDVRSRTAVLSHVVIAKSVLKEWNAEVDPLVDEAHKKHKDLCNDRSKLAKPLESFIATGTLHQQQFDKKVERERQAEEARLRAEQQAKEEARIAAERKILEEQQLAEALRLQAIADEAEREAKILAADVEIEYKRLEELAEQGLKAEYEAAAAALQAKEQQYTQQQATAVELSKQSDAVLSEPTPEPLPVYVAPVVLQKNLPRVTGYKTPPTIWRIIDDENEANIRELCQAIIDRKCSYKALTRNLTFLNPMARSLGEQFNTTNAFPGVRVSDEQPAKG